MNEFIENTEREEETETELQLRQAHIRARLLRAKSRETIPAMIERYRSYGVEL